jgi:Paraquat-inducible protein A
VNEITDLDQRIVNKLSILKNEAIPVLWRYGIPLYLLATLSLLFVSHVGSGVSAKFILNKPDGSIFQEHTLLKVSIFTSVKKLWNTGSFPLAIWIALTSISWPYLKLALGMFAWVVPSRNHRQREQLLEVADVLGKWSFVDIFVLLIIMVAFRSSISLGFGGK